MIIIKRTIPYIASILAAVLLLAGGWYPQQWQWIGPAIAALPIISIIAMRQPQWRSEYIGLSISNLMLLLSAYTFILIQESAFIMYTITTITVVCFFLFLKNLSIFLFEPAKYIAYSLEHISRYSNVVASFFVYTSIFMFYVLGIGRIRFFLLAALLSTAILCWQTFWIQKVPFKRSRWFILVITLLIVEGVWALHYWSTSFFISGFVLTIGLYMLLHISRLYLTELLTRSNVTKFIAVSIITVGVLLVTAQWQLHS